MTEYNYAILYFFSPLWMKLCRSNVKYIFGVCFTLYGSFIFEYDGGDEPIKYTVSAVNKTKIELPASLTEAEVGIVNLP